LVSNTVEKSFSFVVVHCRPTAHLHFQISFGVFYLQSDAIIQSRIQLGEHQFPATRFCFKHFLKLLQLSSINASDFRQVCGDTSLFLDKPNLFELHASEALFEVHKLLYFIKVAVVLHFLLLVLPDPL
jgi:hypothetical protein